MGEDASGADVVELFPDADREDDARPLATVPRVYGCFHRRARLDGLARRVFCRDCGRELDPYDVLARLAEDPERYIRSRRDALGRAQRAREELREVERLLRNAKARLRRRASW